VTVCAVAATVVALVACNGNGRRAVEVIVPELTTTVPPTTAVPGPLTANATVDFVVDGDTLDVVLAGSGEQERVRLIGINTPEIAHPASGTRPANPDDCFGPEAKRYLSLLLPAGSPVHLERDVVARDDYGRLLGYVYRATDGVFANYELARQGFAKPLAIPPNDQYADLFVDAARQAEADDVGLWAACR
jgi:micrococcal nuclease